MQVPALLGKISASTLRIYILICVPAAFIEMVMGLPPWFPFDKLSAAASHISDPVFGAILQFIFFVCGAVLSIGILVGLLISLAILISLWLIGVCFQGLVGLASVSITGALIVLIFVGIALAVLVTKYSAAILEGLAWLNLTLRWLVAFRESSGYPAQSQALTFAAASEGGLIVPDKPDKPRTRVPMRLEIPKISNIGDAIRLAQDSISARFGKKVVDQRAAYLNSQNALGNAALEARKIMYNLHQAEHDLHHQPDELQVRDVEIFADQTERIWNAETRTKDVETAKSNAGKTESEKVVERKQEERTKILSEIRDDFDVPALKRRELRNAYQKHCKALHEELENGGLSDDEYAREFSDLTDQYNYRLEEIHKNIGIHKPSQSKPEPRREDEAERAARLFRDNFTATQNKNANAQKARNLLMAHIEVCVAEGYDRERIEREVKKHFEQNFPGYSWQTGSAKSF